MSKDDESWKEVCIPAFETSSNPTITLADLKKKRYDIMRRAGLITPWEWFLRATEEESSIEEQDDKK